MTPATFAYLWVALALVGLFACRSDPQPADGGSRADERSVPLAENATWNHLGTTWVFGATLPQLTADARAARPLRGLAVQARREDQTSVTTGAALAFDATWRSPITEAGTGEGEILVALREGTTPRRPRLRLLIVADTLRADDAALEMRSSMQSVPEVRRFERAYSTATWTLPSMASIFLAQPPSALRAIDGALIALPDNAATLAQRMREEGFTTVAVVANPTIGHENGFSQGFDLYDVPTYLDGWSVPDATEVVAKADVFANWFRNEDLFLYLHFMDAHDPYRNHESGAVMPSPSTGETVSAAHLAELRTAYRSEVRHLDAVLSGWIEEIAGEREIELLVFTADHGEEFGEHGGFEHGPTVYPEVSQVPLWIGGTLAETIERRLPQDATRAPTSLLHLSELLVAPENWARLQIDRTAPTVETFVHGPPRFAELADATSWFASGQFLEPAPAPATEIERWLRQNGVPLMVRRFDEVGESERQAEWTELPDAVWLRLAGQIGAAASGSWWFVRGDQVAEVLAGTASQANSIEGARVWCWGTCTPSALRAGRSVALLFLPEALADPLDPLFAHDPSRFRWHLREPPRRLPEEGIVIWQEPRREAHLSRGVEETTQRLRKLGYLGN